MRGDCQAITYRGRRCIRTATGEVSFVCDHRKQVVHLCGEHLEAAEGADFVTRNPRTAQLEFRYKGEAEKVFAFKDWGDPDIEGDEE